MKILLSPAKTLDYGTYETTIKCTKPVLLKETISLYGELKKLSASDISKLMSISPKLTSNVISYIKDFDPTFKKQNSKPAILAFKGDVYKGFDWSKYTKKDFENLNSKVRILSGFYGLLKPFDLMQPYRLEMGTDLKNKKGKNLYEFWGDLISDQLNKECKNDKYIINLASDEYFNVINPRRLKPNIIKITFKEKKGNIYKVIGILSKKARGLMTDYIIRNKIEKIEDLKKFNIAKYKFNPKMSSADEFVFIR